MAGLGPQASPEEADTLQHSQPLLAELYSASICGCIASGPRARRRVYKGGDAIDLEDLTISVGPRCAAIAGFSVHADVCIPLMTACGCNVFAACRSFSGRHRVPVGFADGSLFKSHHAPVACPVDTSVISHRVVAVPMYRSAKGFQSPSIVSDEIPCAPPAPPLPFS